MFSKIPPECFFLFFSFYFVQKLVMNERKHDQKKYMVGYFWIHNLIHIRQSLELDLCL